MEVLLSVIVYIKIVNKTNIHSIGFNLFLPRFFYYLVGKFVGKKKIGYINLDLNGIN